MRVCTKKPLAELLCSAKGVNLRGTTFVQLSSQRLYNPHFPLTPGLRHSLLPNFSAMLLQSYLQHSLFRNRLSAYEQFSLAASNAYSSSSSHFYFRYCSYDNMNREKMQGVFAVGFSIHLNITLILLPICILLFPDYNLMVYIPLA